MGRPSIGPVIKTRVPQETEDALTLIAAVRGMTVPDLLREAVDDYVRRVRRGGRVA